MTPLPSSQTFSKHCQAWAEESGSNWIPWNNRKIEFEWLYRADCITMRRRRSILCDILCLISVRWGQWLGLNLELGDNIGSFLERAVVISFLDIIISSHRKLGLVRVSLVWQDSQLHEMSQCYTCCDRDAGICDGADTCVVCHAHQVSGQDCDVQLFLSRYISDMSVENPPDMRLWRCGY